MVNVNMEDMKHANKGMYGVDYVINNYMEAGYSKVFSQSGLNESQLFYLKFLLNQS